MKSSRLRAHLKAAQIYAELSHATRLKVGALIIKDDRPISVGYNGMPSGASNICENTTVNGDVIHVTTKPEVIHAEKNAIAFAAKNGTATKGCTLVITHSPCFDCATLILQSGITAVYYDEEYRDTSGIEFLNKFIKCKKIGK
jgi:dCMP deaminase